jgi:hypothetical protein
MAGMRHSVVPEIVDRAIDFPFREPSLVSKSSLRTSIAAWVIVSGSMEEEEWVMPFTKGW